MMRGQRVTVKTWALWLPGPLYNWWIRLGLGVGTTDIAKLCRPLSQVQARFWKSWGHEILTRSAFPSRAVLLKAHQSPVNEKCTYNCPCPILSSPGSLWLLCQAAPIQNILLMADTSRDCPVLRPVSSPQKIVIEIKNHGDSYVGI